MKAKITYIILIIIGFIFIYNTYFPSWLITGEYKSSISNAYCNQGISDNESLILYENGTYKSDSWGKGKWKVEHELKGTRIEFYNENYNTYFYRKMFFSKPRIVIFRDLNSEFIKK